MSAPGLLALMTSHCLPVAFASLDATCSPIRSSRRRIPQPKAKESPTISILLLAGSRASACSASRKPLLFSPTNFRSQECKEKVGKPCTAGVVTATFTRRNPSPNNAMPHSVPISIASPLHFSSRFGRVALETARNKRTRVIHCRIAAAGIEEPKKIRSLTFAPLSLESSASRK